MDEEERLGQKIKFYFEQQTICHLKLKKEGFLNGKIFEIGSQFIIFNDRLQGNTMVFLEEISSIEPYKEMK